MTKKSENRILLVSPFPPFPPDCGSYQRTHLLWKALSEIAPVDVILCDDLPINSEVFVQDIPSSVNLLGRFRWQSKARRLTSRIPKNSALNLRVEGLLRVALPRHWEYEVDHQLSRDVSEVLDRKRYSLAVGRYLKPIVKTGLVGRVPSLLDIDDVDFDIFAQRAEDPSRPRWERLLYALQSSQIKAAFEKWLPRFKKLWVTKAEDTQHAVTRNAAVLPNIPYNLPNGLAPLNGSSSCNPVILTVGVLFYVPNRDGIDRFIREGWPKVRAACPTAEYWLVGKNDPASARRWGAVPGVKVLGYVEDLAAIYQASWFSLCPLWNGGGTNIKVLESLAFGRTCVATGIGHRGHGDLLKSGDSLLVAATAAELAESCIQLINDREKRLALAQRGHDVVREEFSYKKFASVVRCQVEEALGDHVRTTGNRSWE
jgi:polysaccharide biosynthesis protein PslH